MTEKGFIIKQSEIQNRIFTFRSVHVMIDRDLAELYQVETKILNQAVKRNIDKFPKEFRFQLTKEEHEFLRLQNVTIKEDVQILKSQNVTLKDKRGKHSKYLPYVFTEQGVSMLSAVLRSDTAVKISITIMNAFVEMRKFIATNATIFQRLDKIELKQLVTDQKFEKVFKALESKDTIPKQGIFFDGQIFDAHKFVSDIIRTAKKSIVLIDNYIDDTVLTVLSKKSKSVKLTILTKSISKQLQLDIAKYKNQYGELSVIQFDKAHDRFLIIDNETVYHMGASLKDLGKKWFAFSKMEKDSVTITQMLKEIIN